MDSKGLIIYISPADTLAEQEMGSTMGEQTLGRLNPPLADKNLPTIVTCTPTLRARNLGFDNRRDTY